MCVTLPGPEEGPGSKPPVAIVSPPVETPQNSPPVAVDDAYAMRGDQQLGANVLANDIDADGDTLAALLVAGPSHGTLTLDAAGTFTYKPDRGFEGLDSFSYRASDGPAESDPATVQITVSAGTVNGPPTGIEDTYVTLEDQPLSVGARGVLANDLDAEGDPLSAVLASAPRHGTLVLGSDGSFDYAPRVGFHGTDTFTYLANDGQTDSAPTTVTITVDPVNRAPAAADDSFSTPQDQVLSVPAGGVLANDQDPDGDTLTTVLATGPANGTLTLNGDGSFDYAPSTGFHGTDSFTYAASDGQAASNPATVTITVDPVNHAPVEGDDSFSTPQDQVLSVPAGGVLANDQDPDGDTLTAVLATGPANGTLTLNADGSFDYTPGAGFHGTDSFTYAASDGQAASNPATVTITVDPVNHAPVAGDDSFSTPQDQVLSVPAGGVLANDQDPDGDTLTAVLATGPANGTLTLNADGSFDYTPGAGFHGTDSFTYAASDGQAASNPATVTVTVSPTEAPPAKELECQLQVSGAAFGPDAGPIWGGSTFWVSAYVQDLRQAPLGVVGGAIDVQFDTGHVSPTGSVVYGDRFTDYRQGSIDSAAGVIDEAGALATQGGAGADGLVPFVSWEFRRSGAGAPNDPNSRVTFAAGPGGGTGTVHPANFALVGLGTPVDWASVQFDAVELSLSLGDFNHDGAVNHYDLALWIPHASSSFGDQSFNPEYDLNADARVDQADLALLMPRLYQPVLSDAPPAPNGRSPARSQRLGSSIPSLADDADLDWVASVAGRRHHGPGGSPANQLAVDRVFQAAESWRPA